MSIRKAIDSRNLKAVISWYLTHISFKLLKIAAVLFSSLCRFLSVKKIGLFSQKSERR